MASALRVWHRDEIAHLVDRLARDLLHAFPAGGGCGCARCMRIRSRRERIRQAATPHEGKRRRR